MSVENNIDESVCYSNFSITDRAANQIMKVLEENQVFKITVEPGGCNGFEYKFTIENYSEDFKEFHSFYRDKRLVLVIDKASIDLMKGATLDYEKELMYEKFAIKNPNSKASCSCGNSFVVF